MAPNEDAERYRIVLTVADDGTGHAPGAAPGFGLSGMRERVEALGGSWLLETPAEGGLRVRIAVPLGAAPAGETGHGDT